MIPSALAIALAVTPVEPQTEGTQAWAPAARASVDDQLVIDLALSREGLTPSDASVLFGQQQVVVTAEGRLRDIAGVGWIKLSGGTVVDAHENMRMTDQPACGRLDDPGPLPTERRLIALPGRPRAERYDATGGPEVVLATAGRPQTRDLEELAIVIVNPGETVQVTTIYDPRRRRSVEVLEMERPEQGQRVTLVRDETMAEACFFGTPPEVRDEQNARIDAILDDELRDTPRRARR